MIHLFNFPAATMVNDVEVASHKSESPADENDESKPYAIPDEDDDEEERKTKRASGKGKAKKDAEESGSEDEEEEPEEYEVSRRAALTLL